MQKRAFAALIAALALSATTAFASTTSVSGTVVNIASYISGDGTATTFNMGAMMGNGSAYGMSNGGMMGGYGAHGAMNGCRSALGLVTSGGTVYLLVTDAPSTGMFALCSEIGSHVTLRGTIFEKGGVRALRVEHVGN
ncbi:MAG TPA: hypothetical protein VFN49_08275 [Candidatus Aquilonibacter sp.]|nr:hypothetical protein [Candidatus Aquilonibacter sp.]